MITYWEELPEGFSGDLAVGPLYGDRPPTRGLAGWADWRFGEPIAAALLAGKLSPDRGEKLLLPGRSPFQVAKIVLVGLSRFVEETAEVDTTAGVFAEAVRNLGARRLLLEIPSVHPQLFVQAFANSLGADAPDEIFAYIPEAPCRI